MSDINDDKEVDDLLGFLLKAANCEMTLEVVADDGVVTLTIPENNYGDAAEQKTFHIDVTHDGKFFLGG